MSTIQSGGGRRGGVPRGLDQTGPVLFSYGFRPFFLGAGVMAVAGMGLWIASLAFALPVAEAYGTSAWHAHEMLFGFAPAVLAGFLMTAIPNWTGQMPLAGRLLAALAGLWLAGRIAMLSADAIGPVLAALIDAAFLPALAAVCARELIAGRKWKDMKILGGVALVGVANIGFHGQVLLAGYPGTAARAGTAGFALLVMIVGGRIIPSFTRNRLALSGVSRLPVPFNPRDGIAIGLAFVALLIWVAVPEGGATALAALVGAAAVLWRLSRWRGAATWREPLLLVLHVAFGFVGLGSVAIAAAALGWLSPAAAMHVLLVGGIGGMMLGVMTRATRGHTGRPLTASRWTLVSYLSLFGAALARPAADIAGAPRLLEVAGGLWIAAFLLFLAEYGPMLVRERQKAART